MNNPTWKISGVVEEVYPLEGTIKLWLSGFDHFETVPIADSMPEWMLTSDAAFRTTIPRECVSRRSLAGVVWGKFFKQDYSDLSMEQLFELLNDTFKALATRDRKRYL